MTLAYPITFPSAPDPCQPDNVNLIYWPTGDLAQRRAYEHGERARVGAHHDDRVLMITGPLALAAKRDGRVPGLRIVTPHATNELAAGEKDFARVARATRATLILGGGIQRAGDQLRITCSLVRAPLTCS